MPRLNDHLAVFSAASSVQHIYQVIAVHVGVIGGKYGAKSDMARSKTNIATE